MTTHECNECGRLYLSKLGFVKHVYDYHDGQEYYFKHRDELFKNVVRCEECDRQFSSHKGLSKHVCHLHNPKQYFLEHIDAGAGKCRNPTCDNETTFRSLMHGNTTANANCWGWGFDPYCSNNCAHADPNSKFHAVGNGYALRAITAETTAADILEKEDYEDRKFVKYLPHTEYAIALHFKRIGFDFVWQKAFGTRNVDFFFNGHIIVELYEPLHKCPVKVETDRIRKEEILSSCTIPNIKWVTVPLSSGTTIVNAIQAITDVVFIL